MGLTINWKKSLSNHAKTLMKKAFNKTRRSENQSFKAYRNRWKNLSSFIVVVKSFLIAATHVTRYMLLTLVSSAISFHAKRRA